MKPSFSKLFKAFVYFIVSFALFPEFSTGQSVGIGAVAFVPATNAMLDVDVSALATKKGMLVPRMTYAQRIAIAATAGGDYGLLVYQTNYVSAILPNGYWYWDGVVWNHMSVGNAGTAWSILGNAGTNAATNFIGTTDGNDFVIRTGNTEKVRVTTTGYVGIGTNAPACNLSVNNGGGQIANIGNVFCNTNYSGITLNGTVGNCTDYNFLSSNTDKNLYINRPTGFGISFRMANVDHMVIDALGNVGINTAPSYKLHVLDDADNKPVIFARNINTSAGTTSFGVRGEVNASGLGSAGVYGYSNNSGQNEIGVLGDYSLWGASLFGLAWASAYTDMPATRDFGCFATVNFSTGTGVYGRNTNSTIGSAYGMYCWGNFAVTGVKSASVPTSRGNQLLYCNESPEVWFEDFGTSQLSNGITTVTLDPLFIETVVIDAQHPMHVFLQEENESNGLVVTTGTSSFQVIEKANGTSNAKFSYRIVGKRKNYQDVRFGCDANQPLEDNSAKNVYQQPATTDPLVMKANVDRWTREKEAIKKTKASGR
ncbi:hypothetical protein BH11BAC1_BH11BAC1_25250 [soil metagenome]